MEQEKLYVIEEKASGTHIGRKVRFYRLPHQWVSLSEEIKNRKAARVGCLLCGLRG